MGDPPGRGQRKKQNNIGSSRDHTKSNRCAAGLSHALGNSRLPRLLEEVEATSTGFTVQRYEEHIAQKSLIPQVIAPAGCVKEKLRKGGKRKAKKTGGNVSKEGTRQALLGLQLPL
jgi:hypothetical protein